MVTEFGSATDGAEAGGPKLGEAHTPPSPLLEPALALLLVAEPVVWLLPPLEPELVPTAELVEPLEVPPLMLVLVVAVVVLAELELPIELLPVVLGSVVLLALELNWLLERPDVPPLVPKGGSSFGG
jgi:hypothetical protein